MTSEVEFDVCSTGLRHAMTVFPTARVFIREVQKARRHEASGDCYEAWIGGSGDAGSDARGRVVLLRRVLVCGVVVARDDRGTVLRLGVDDGTGVAACVVFAADAVSWAACARGAGMRLGAAVRVRGRITDDYRGQRVLSVDKIEPILDPNHESLWRLQVVRFYSDFYANQSSSTLPAHFTPAALRSRLDRAIDSNLSFNKQLDFDLENSDNDPAVLKQTFLKALEDFKAKQPATIAHLAVILKQYINFHRLDFVDFDIVSGDYVLRQLAESVGVKQLAESVGVKQLAESVGVKQLAESVGVKQQTSTVSTASNKSNTNKSALKITQIISVAFQIVVKDGFMYKTDDSDGKDLYTVIRHDLNLGAAVFAAVQKYSRDGGPKEYAENGVPHDAIGLVMREGHPEFR
ncbi:hypothetical protein HK100_004204, partial [Physocladia obscura]